jgi:outer membrane immunogenic protein
MKHYLYGALSALALTAVATPAFAQDAATTTFSGPRVGMIVGAGGDDIVDFDGVTIGVDAGYDWDMGGAVVGIGAEYQTDLGDDFLDANQTAILARVGAKVGSKALIYGTGGYSHVSTGVSPFGGLNADGYIIGGGAEFALGNQGTSFKIEQRYLDYGNGVDLFQTLAGLSFRF